MPFVKLDCGILNSTLWFEREMREVFLTALLMAEPQEFTEPIPQIEVRKLKTTGWSAPPGWYGFVPAAGIGIIHRARVEEAAGYAALEQLGRPEASSRSPEHEGRRLIRIDGGYLVLNYMRYRERDYTAAERSRRYREKKRQDEQHVNASQQSSRRSATASHRDITQAEAEAEAEAEKKEKSAPRAKRPNFVGQRLTVFDWQEANCRKILGSFADDFNLPVWFVDLDEQAERTSVVIPRRDGGAWLEARLVEECQRRGLPIATATRAPKRAGVSGGGNCPHVPRCARATDCVQRTIAEAKAQQVS